jgi:hypothetical protein
MKRVIRNLAIALFTVLTFSSCGDLFNTDIKLDVPFEVTFDVVATPGKGVFSVVDTIDVLSYPQLAQYTELIQSINIQDIEVEVISLTPDTIVLTSCNMMAAAGTLPSTSWSLSNEQLTAGRIFNLDNSNNQLTSAHTIFTSQLPIAINLNGVVDAETAQFTLKVTFNSEVVVSPLGK